MAIPDFDDDGFLPFGLWKANLSEVQQRFGTDGIRSELAHILPDIVRFAENRGATRIVFGGSFVSSVPEPNDIDCVIVFASESQIPERIERLEVGGTRLDIFVCSEDQPALLGGIISLFQINRANNQVGAVEVKLRARRELSEIIEHPSDSLLEIIRSAYFNRHIVELAPSPRALITVHGIRSHSEWSAEISHIMSANGWIVAPFIYGFQSPAVFISKKRRSRIVDLFRAHIFDIKERYDADVSVIAHSFGTYVAARYLLGFDQLPVGGVDTFIMTGSVLYEGFDLTRFDGRVRHILNEVAPRDAVVRWPSMFRLSDRDFGRAGRVGFKEQSPYVEEGRCEVFGHNNVIRRDVVVQRWLPRLEAYVGSWRRANQQQQPLPYRFRGRSY